MRRAAGAALVLAVIAVAVVLAGSLTPASGKAQGAVHRVRPTAVARPRAMSANRSLEAQLKILRGQLKREPRGAITAPGMAPLGATCFVGADGCSETPCVEFVGETAQPAVYVVPPARSQCVKGAKAKPAPLPVVVAKRARGAARAPAPGVASALAPAATPALAPAAGR